MKGKRFKVVFKSQMNSYELWFTDNEGEWVKSIIYYTFAKDGNIIKSRYVGNALIDEFALWEMNKLINLGYKFIGIEVSE